MLDVWRRYPFHGQERYHHPVRSWRRSSTRSTRRRIEQRGDGAAAMRGGGPDRRRAFAGRVVREWRFGLLPYEWVGAILAGGSGEAARGRGPRCAAGRRLRRRGGGGRPPRTRRCSARTRASGWASRALAGGPRRRRRGTSASILPAYEEVAVPAIAVVGTGEVESCEDGGRRAPARAARRADRERRGGDDGTAEPPAGAELVETRHPMLDGSRRALALRAATPHPDHLEIAAVAGVDDDRLPPGRRGPGRSARSSRTSGTVRASPPSASAGRRSCSTGSGGRDPAGRRRAAAMLRRAARDTTSPIAHRPLPRGSSPTSWSRSADGVDGAISGSSFGCGRPRPSRAASPCSRPVRQMSAGSRPTSSISPEASATAASLARSSAGSGGDLSDRARRGAAIDLVAEHALDRGRRVVLAANDVVGAGLDEALLALAPAEVTI